jgi:hypothetical protein
MKRKPHAKGRATLVNRADMPLFPDDLIRAGQAIERSIPPGVGIKSAGRMVASQRSALHQTTASVDSTPLRKPSAEHVIATAKIVSMDLRLRMRAMKSNARKANQLPTTARDARRIGRTR